MVPPILVAIERHSRSVLDGSSSCRTEDCPRCESPAPFQRHGVRRRQFFFVVDAWVRVVRSFVCRYRCGACGTTFTDYPAFAIPRKRYVVSAIVDHAGAYVNDDPATYRSTVKAPSGAPMFYAPSSDAPSTGIDDRSFTQTTLWRWMACLAAMKNTARAAKRLVREKTDVFAPRRPVAPWKARSHDRAELLDNAADLVATATEFAWVFSSTSIFTALATRHGFA
jgi:hypothetical protein